jgi:hypothetical protein
MTEEMYELKLTHKQLVVLHTLTEHAMKLKRTDRDREIGTELLARLTWMLVSKPYRHDEP